MLEVHRALPEARLVAVHMEALNHCATTRANVRRLAEAHGIADRVLVPEDGEVLAL